MKNSVTSIYLHMDQNREKAFKSKIKFINRYT